MTNPVFKIHTHGDKQNGVERVHPQFSYAESTILPTSFFGSLRRLYYETVLSTQLGQMRKQGSYDAFKLEWHPTYEVRRLYGGKARIDGIPPSLFWESDVGKWIEAACYFLGSPDGSTSKHKAEFDRCIQELVDMIEKAQQPDGYVNIYFVVVDPAGKFKNLRDLHEMYNTGHLLEAAIAHYQYTGSRQFLDVMIKAVACFAKQFGPNDNQLHGYPGHPELELAVLRLYALTRDPQHLAFGEYLLSARGVQRDDQKGKSYFPFEAMQREDPLYSMNLPNTEDMRYNQSHLPLHEQDAIEGHSVRALYLLTAAADASGPFTKDARRIWDNAINKKMYITGGLGSEPRTEGFDPIPYRLPQSTDEGGCYAETCASIACMMTSERLLSHQPDGKVRDVLERCLYNNVIGGGSLNGKQFSYANKHATYGDEVATRADWFEVCCCPPNLSRTLGMLGGYTWSADVDVSSKTIHLDVYILLSAARTISLPGGDATVKMTSKMPNEGETRISFSAPDGWKWAVRLPSPEYADNIKISAPAQLDGGFFSVQRDANASLDITFDLPIRLLSSHPETNQDTLTIQRGPIVYVAESFDNAEIERDHPHFRGIGIHPASTLTAKPISIGGIDMMSISTGDQDVYALDKDSGESLYRPIDKSGGRSWRRVGHPLHFVPWFARANRDDASHVRVGMLRVQL